MKRREFLSRALAGTAGLLCRGGFAASAADESSIFFSSSDARYQLRYQAALKTLAANTIQLQGYAEPVLMEGSEYHGIWLECAPQEGLVYAAVNPTIARNNHAAFFALQREDGQIPYHIRADDLGWGQIQMVVPIAATAWELAQSTHDEQLLATAYAACSRWDAWLRRYRDTRKTGLCEGFCTFDTGHDNSPRWAGMPNSNHDAHKCPPVPSLPRLCPDLSATVYGGRVALAAMAKELGMHAEEERWLADAEQIRAAIVARLYDAGDACFYDLDAQNNFVKVRGDLITRVLGEHVVDQRIFDAVYARQIHNPKSFWAAYPLPSIALDDPTFVRPIPRNSWGGASQALTALRAPRWMEHYGRPADLAHLMQQWVAALLRADDFRQQMDPLTGEFTDGAPGYSPAALVLLDFTWRLAGVRSVDGDLEWNIRPGFAGERASYRLHVTPYLTAELRYEAGGAELRLNDKLLCRANGTARVITTREGKLIGVVGVASDRSTLSLHFAAGTMRRIAIEPNRTVRLA
jgi:hypothetical protein